MIISFLLDRKTSCFHKSSREGLLFSALTCNKNVIEFLKISSLILSL